MSLNQSSVHQGHRERLRERYRQNGMDGFSDHEILELLLGYCHAQKDTNPMGHALIERFGNLQGVFEADENDLKEVADIGAYSAFLLKLIPGICRRYFLQLSKDDLKLNGPFKYGNFFSSRFIGKEEECLYAAFLDANFKLIDCTQQFVGSINAVEIHAGKILHQAQRKAARYVILAHNHFTDATPSVQDLAATKTVYHMLAEYKIELLDHVIVCGSITESMRSSGHLAKCIY